MDCTDQRVFCPVFCRMKRLVKNETNFERIRNDLMETAERIFPEEVKMTLNGFKTSVKFNKITEMSKISY